MEDMARLLAEREFDRLAAIALVQTMLNRGETSVTVYHDEWQRIIDADSHELALTNYTNESFTMTIRRKGIER